MMRRNTLGSDPLVVPVIFWQAPFEIRFPVVRWIVVEVAAFMTCWLFAFECGQNESVNGMLPVFA